MKLKFRADKKDWIIFGGYALVLLYFVAIALLNIMQFAKGDLDHPFHGFNPFPAFSSDNIGLTLTCYVIALVASIFSVSDRFFDREKGFGISTEAKKASKGYSRWTSSEEMKKELTMVKVQAPTADAGGLPLINDGKKMWVDNGEGHTLIIGSTGAGKTQVAIFPLVHSLAKHDESMIITDPKGEIYETTAEMLRKRGYNVVLLNFRNPQQGSGWNPLHLPYKYYKEGNSDKANELTDDLAMNILYDENAQNNDPFWEKTSADYFSGICLGLFEDAKEDEINLNSVNLFTTIGEEKCGPNSTYSNEYFKTKEPTSPAYISASSTISAPSDTKGSILSVFKQKIRLFAARENLSEMLSHSDFEFEDIGRKKPAVFIVIQDEKKTYHSLVTIFLKQCYETLVDYAQKCGGKLPYRTNFLLDEFANMPPLKDVDTMVSAARSRKMRFFFVIQNYAQLAEVYGKEKGDTIRGNCTNIVYLISTELSALKEISEMCGEVKVKTDKKDKDGKAIEETRPLITVSDLQKLKMGEIILLRLRMDPFRTKLKLNYQIDWGDIDKCEKATYPTREKQPLHVFDLKTFVNKKREEKREESMNKLISQVMPNMNKNNASMPGINRPNGLPGMGVSSNRKPMSMEEMLKNIDKAVERLEKEEQRKQSGIMGKTNTVGKVNPVKVPASMANDSTIDPVKVSNNVIMPKKPDSNVKEKPMTTIKPKQVVMPSTPKEVAVKPRVEKKPEVKNIINSADFAAKITNKVNQTVKENKSSNVNNEVKPTISKPEIKTETIKKNDYVTDDQFFDDFFADDDD
mgnify:CR=1 FL=1